MDAFSIFDVMPLSLPIKQLYGSTAGIAVASPIAVVMSVLRLYRMQQQQGSLSLSRRSPETNP